MPELFVSFFALRAGLVTVVQSAIVGSILANTLLIMGLAFLFGGWKNGTQRFGSERPRAMAILMVLAVAALVMPTLVDTILLPLKRMKKR
jgi:Ca2+:H+ antiporter